MYVSLLDLDLTDITGSVMRITDAHYEVYYEGHLYQPFGVLVNIDKITVENTLSSKELSITLSGISTDMAEAVNNTQFRRKSITIRKAYVPEGTDQVADASIYWRGLTSTPESMVDYDKGMMALKVSCKSLFDLDQKPSLMRSNNATHQALYDGDLFFQYANQDLGDDVLWRK